MMKRVIVRTDFLASDQASYETEARDALIRGERVVVFDLGRVEYIDSIAVSMIESLCTEAEKSDAVILLDNLSSVVTDFFNLLELNRHFYTRLPLERAQSLPPHQ
jgi:anti-anti-sigma regulatory factor